MLRPATVVLGLRKTIERRYAALRMVLFTVDVLRSIVSSLEDYVRVFGFAQIVFLVY